MYIFRPIKVSPTAQKEKGVTPEAPVTAPVYMALPYAVKQLCGLGTLFTGYVQVQSPCTKSTLVETRLDSTGGHAALVAS